MGLELAIPKGTQEKVMQTCTSSHAMQCSLPPLCLRTIAFLWSQKHQEHLPQENLPPTPRTHVEMPCPAPHFPLRSCILSQGRMLLARHWCPREASTSSSSLHPRSLDQAEEECPQWWHRWLGQLWAQEPGECLPPLGEQGLGQLLVGQ